MLMWVMIILAAGTMLVLGLFIAYVLGWANKAFHVPVDERLEKLIAELPGANCGGCGYVGCTEYAAALLRGEVGVNKCTVGGVSCATALARIMGVGLEESWPYRAVVHCGATYADRLHRRRYLGEQTCVAANIISGVQGCTYGCLGLGDCDRSCRFDAIHIIDGLARVDYDKCTGCGACAKVCPRNIITMVPFKAERMAVIACSNRDFGKDVKAVCKAGCTGCGLCQKMSELFKLTDNLPAIDYAKYDPKAASLEAALAKCPMKRVTYVGKPSARDLEAVAAEKLPSAIQADFQTTVDKTEWHG